MRKCAAVAASLGDQADGMDGSNPATGGEDEAVEAGLFSNPIEFDGIKTGVVELLPDAEEENRVLVLEPLLDVEPNSELGGAIKYLQKRWKQLTQFLRIPGAPLDNNEAERVLKRSILHRKNSLHYKTDRGARVGDLFMSLVETCRANQVNPFEYMMAVVKNAPAAKVDPGRWMPWNFQAALPEEIAQAP